MSKSHNPKNGPPADERQANQLMEEGLRLLNQGEVAAAREKLERAVQQSAGPAAVNNLALLHLEGEQDPERALEVLAPNLDPSSPHLQPFAYSLAARCLARLDQTSLGKRHLESAVAAFELGLRQGIPASRGGEWAWREYTTSLLQAAGELGEDRRAWDLFRRYSHLHVLPESHFYGGIAAFNLGRYESAARTWRGVTGQARHGAKGQSWRFLDAYIEISDLFERGVLPPLLLPYRPPQPDIFLQLGEDVQEGSREKDELVQRLCSSPPDLLLVLHVIFYLHQDPNGKAGLLAEVVAAAGEWGDRLAQNLFDANSVDMDLKMAAAQGLLFKGRIQPGQAVRMRVDGRDQEVTLTQHRTVLGWDADLQRNHDEILALRDAGRTDEARQRLEDMIYEEDTLWPPMLVTYANLLRDEEEFDQARKWLEMANAAMPDQAAILFNLAGVCAQQEDFSAALEYLDQVDMRELPSGVRAHARGLRRYLEGGGHHGQVQDLDASPGEPYFYGHTQGQMRRDAQEKAMPPGSTTLARALKKIPAEWLDAACSLHGIAEPAHYRQDREKQLAEHLLAAPDQIAAVLEEHDVDLNGQGRALVEYLLEHGGWSTAAPVTRLFGTDDGDGFFWTRQLPVSPVGRLQAIGLVFVGRHTLGGRRQKVLVVPVDLREPLAEVLLGS